MVILLKIVNFIPTLYPKGAKENFLNDLWYICWRAEPSDRGPLPPRLLLRIPQALLQVIGIYELQSELLREGCIRDCIGEYYGGLRGVLGV